MIQRKYLFAYISKDNLFPKRKEANDGFSKFNGHVKNQMHNNNNDDND